jgi:hypothetical protein
LGVPALGGPLGRLFLKLRDAALRATNVNVVVAECMAEIVRKRGIAPERIRVIPNWCDDEDIQPIAPLDNPLRREWKLEDRFVIGYSGNSVGDTSSKPSSARQSACARTGAVVSFFIGGTKKFSELALCVRPGPSLLLPPLSGAECTEIFTWRSGRPSNFAEARTRRPNRAEQALRDCRAGQPIIAVAACDGEVARLVRRHDCGIVVEPGRGEVLADSLRRLQANSDRLRNGASRAPCSMLILRAGRPSNAGETLSRRSSRHRRALNNCRLRRDILLTRSKSVELY